MFKFNFDIDDTDDLQAGSLEISSNSKIQSPQPSPGLEPFTETLIDHLVRFKNYLPTDH